MQSRRKAIIVAIGVAMVLAAYFSGEDELSLSEPEWDSNWPTTSENAMYLSQ